MKRTVKKIAAQPVKIRYAFLKILTGSDLSRRRLPFMAAESKTPGPVVWLTACCHGDEVGGIVIIQEIFKKIRKKQALLKGAVFAFPLMNPIGFETASRHITFSKEDLNRSFPGDQHGSLGERIADIIFSSIIDTDPTIVLDLHNDWIKSIPYAVIDPDSGHGSEDVNRRTECFCAQTGLLMVREAEVLQSSLAFSLRMQGIPALTLELGESYIINERNIEYGVKSIEKILAHLEMIAPVDEPFQYPLPGMYQGKILKYFSRPFSSTSGIIRFLAAPGDCVIKGQAVAKVYNTFGRLQETMTALYDGIVLGHSDSSVAFPGMRVLAYGIEPETSESHTEEVDQHGT